MRKINLEEICENRTFISVFFFFNVTWMTRLESSNFLKVLRVAKKEDHDPVVSAHVTGWPFPFLFNTESINFDHHLRCGGWPCGSVAQR